MKVLAPVGNFQMLYAALAGGADEIYMAGPSFGARAYAENFSLKEIKEIVNICHLNGVGVHVTVNTLIKEGEQLEALSFVNELYNYQVDAVIVQDLGLGSLIKRHLPDLDLHLSTQVSLNNEQGLEYFRDMGYKRLILARETPFKDISRLTNKGIEIEVFGHGSLCVSYSGKCLMSSMIGDRSGNRGRCAQPCRKPYFLLDSIGSKISEEAMDLISPKDFSTGNFALDLAKIGVESLKIEGRLKRPDYVYATCKYYKSILRDENPSEDDLKLTAGRGFTKGLIRGAFAKAYVNPYEKARGQLVGKIVGGDKKFIYTSIDLSRGDTLEIELVNKKQTITLKDDYKERSKILLDKFDDAILGSNAYRISSAKLRDLDFEEIVRGRKFPVQMSFCGKTGRPAELKVTYKNKTIKVYSKNNLEASLNKALNHEYAYQQLVKLGESPFYLQELTSNIQEEPFMPASVLNDMRRRGVEKLLKEVAKVREVKQLSRKALTNSKIRNKENNKKISVMVENLNLLDKDIADKVDYIYLESLEGLGIFNHPNIYYCLPLVSSTIVLKEELRLIGDKENYLKGVVFSNIWEAKEIKKIYDLELISGPSLYPWNSSTIELLKREGAQKIILPYELTLDEIKALNVESRGLNLMVYGQVEDMIMVHCPASLIGPCNLKCDTCKYRTGYKLKGEFDTYDMVRSKNHTILRDEKRISALGKIRKILGSNSFDTLMFVVRSKEDMEITKKSIKYIREKNYKNLEILSKKLNTKEGHYERGVL